jgi:serine/threonine protein kinase
MAQLGLEELHGRGVAARCVSPNAVLVAASGHARLTLSRASRPVAGRAVTLCGAPEYLAPEMVAGRGHTEAVDWWALGVLLYCVLTRRTPYHTPGAPPAAAAVVL